MERAFWKSLVIFVVRCTHLKPNLHFMHTSTCQRFKYVKITLFILSPGASGNNIPPRSLQIFPAVSRGTHKVPVHVNSMHLELKAGRDTRSFVPHPEIRLLSPFQHPPIHPQFTTDRMWSGKSPCEEWSMPRTVSSWAGAQATWSTKFSKHVSP